MATGDVVGIVLRELPPAASAATLDTRAGGSTPAETVLVHDFDASADEFVDYLVQLEGYNSGADDPGITIKLKWSASSATGGTCVWQAAVRRVADDAEDIDGSHTYVFNTVSATAPNVSGEVGYDSITFTHGADMDSWVDGEIAILRIGRDVDPTDDMTGDAELWGIVITET